MGWLIHGQRLRPPEVPGKFYVLYWNQAIYRFRNLTADGGEGTALLAWQGQGRSAAYLTPSRFYDPGPPPGYQVTLTTAGEGGSPVPLFIGNSQDEGLTWNIRVDSAGPWGGVFKPRYDFSNFDVGWLAFIDEQPGAVNATHLYRTLDNGVTWQRIDLDDVRSLYGATAFVDWAEAAPRHDGEFCFVPISVAYQSGAQQVHAYLLSRVRYDGTYLTITLNSWPYDSGIFSPAVDPTARDSVYGIMGYHVVRITWPNPTIQTLSVPWNTSTDWIETLAISPTGTLYVPVFKANGTFYVYRTSNGGASWYGSDLSATIPAWGWWDYDFPNVAVAQSGMVAVYWSTGKVVFSQDGGSTWNSSAVLGLAEEGYADFGGI